MNAEALLRRIGSGAFSGITLGRWLKLLAVNRFAVDLPYWPRAAGITLNSLPNTVLAALESLVYGRKIGQARVQPPLFVLGIWRSGTTHLHNLLGQDPRLAYLNNYQVFFPLTYLLTERLNSWWLDRALPERRPQDNMTMRVHEPQEDEFCFCSMTGEGFTVGWSFPRSQARYDRFLTLRDASAAERERWKSALRHIVQKASFKYDKPLVLKSPAHTARIELLLELFPDARFVHIHRHPYAVYQSTLHLFHKGTPWWTMQRMDHRGLENRVLDLYQRVYEAYFAERHLIPAGRLVEVRYEGLEQDPIAELRKVYGSLELGDFSAVEPRLQSYLATLSGYRKNSFDNLPDEVRRRIASRWRRSFDEWQYAV